MTSALLAKPAPADYPPCPDWCSGVHPAPVDGFEAYPWHTGTLAEAVTVDDYRVRVTLERADFDSGSEHEAGLYVDFRDTLNGPVQTLFYRLTRAQRTQLAAAMLRANELEPQT